MTTWKEIRDEVAGMLADGQPLEDIISKLEQYKNEMAKAELIAVFDELKKPKSLTNEEWLHTLNTEQKAEWLTNVINTNPCGYLLFCDECSLNDKCKEDDYPTNIETWVEWLKQPHREIEK